MLKLDEKMIAEVKRRGWGVAGFIKGNTIIATKIPKSGYLKQYLDEKNPENGEKFTATALEFRMLSLSVKACL